MSQEPINIAGVCAFPNPNGVRDMRFVDCNYNTLFRLPNHSSIIMTKPDGTQMKQQCSYIDDYHIYILCGGRKIPGAARQLCGAASPAEQAGKEQAQA